MITKTNTRCYIVSVLEVSSVKKFIKSCNLYVVKTQGKKLLKKSLFRQLEKGVHLVKS